MKRALCGLALGASALLSAPAHAYDPGSTNPVDVFVVQEDGTIRFGSSLGGQPLAGGWVDTNTGEVCAGFSYQLPLCVGG